MLEVRHDRPALALAPMEGVTDAPMRQLMSERGAFSYCVTEFLRVSQDVPPRHLFLRHIPELGGGARTVAGLPVQVQLLGGDPEKMARAAQVAVEAGATAIDLNFGCPAPTVNRHDGGATLLKHPERLRAIVKAVRQALPLAVPVSAKLRLGWDDPGAIHGNAERAAEGGAAWITIHGRTRTQGYRPPAFWGPIGEVRRRLGIPVVANGEIWTVEDLLRCRDETGCQHFMLGRGALADPSLSTRAAQALGLPVQTPDPGEVAWLPLLQRFAALSASFSDRPLYPVGRIKQWARMSHLRFPNRWYEAIKTLRTLDEILAAVAAHGVR
ncbi:MAG TPA: tRNA-dihydrouridine synthase family protein [Myxococcota bacterium]|nr:tRNA-dihydrouridine synthase family protein [Myxococcota bacterium]